MKQYKISMDHFLGTVFEIIFRPSVKISTSVTSFLSKSGPLSLRTLKAFQLFDVTIPIATLEPFLKGTRFK